MGLNIMNRKHRGTNNKYMLKRNPFWEMQRVILTWVMRKVSKTCGFKWIYNQVSNLMDEKDSAFGANGQGIWFSVP